MTRKILHLTLHRQWFAAIAAETKTEEYRAATPYWQTRLEGKAFDEVHFRNGYSPDRPFMRVACEQIEFRPEKGIFIIHLGKILDLKNY